MAEDAFDLLDGDDRVTLLAAARKLGDWTPCCLFKGELDLWRECYRVLQGAEIWQAHGGWITRERPTFADDIAARFADAATITAAAVNAMTPVRARIAEHVRSLAPPGTILLLPSALGAALGLGTHGGEIGQFYARALSLTAAAGHAGLPQISLPLAQTNNRHPLGLGAIAGAGGDSGLLHLFNATD